MNLQEYQEERKTSEPKRRSLMTTQLKKWFRIDVDDFYE